MSEIPKAYEPQAVESKWYQSWLDHQFFVADPARVTAKRPAYSILSCARIGERYGISCVAIESHMDVMVQRILNP